MQRKVGLIPTQLILFDNTKRKGHEWNVNDKFCEQDVNTIFTT